MPYAEIIKCDICGGNVKHETYRGDIDIEEEYFLCDKCGYSRMYSYGVYSETIDGETWDWSWSDSEKCVKSIFDAIEAAKTEAKKKWAQEGEKNA